MKKYLLVITLCFFSVAASAASVEAAVASSCSNFFPYGKPTTDKATSEICRPTYFIKYYDACKAPLYVIEYVTSAAINGREPRGAFRPDPLVAKDVRGSSSDYTGSGYDKGHMAPAANFQGDHDGMHDSFYLSNAVPQAPSVNRGVWRALETHARTVAVKQKGVYIITGAVYGDNPVKIGSGICVPDYTFKVIIDPRAGQAIAYHIKNVNEANILPITLYQENVETVEKLSGINFAPTLPTTSNMKTAIGSQLTGRK